MDTVLLSERFRRFAERECKGSSKLYEYLSIEISGDYDLLKLSSHCSPGQPVPNLLFASVHLDYFIDGVEFNEIVAETDGHGRWFDWNVR